MPTEHAVRWELSPQAIRSREPIYTKWHATETGAWTRCGRHIQIVPSLPETEELEKVDCTQCLKRMRVLVREADVQDGRVRGALGERPLMELLVARCLEVLN